MANPPKPGFFEKINFVLKWIWDPCDAPLEIYAQTALPAFLKALWTYLQPDWLDILTSFARPRVSMRRLRGSRKGGRGKRHGRWGKGYAWTKFLDFDTNEFLAKKLPGFDEFSGRYVSNGVAHLWTFFGVLERINFYWFVINLILDFFFDWMSLILKLKYCEEMDRVVLRVHHNGSFGVAIFGWTACLMPIIDKQRGPVTWNLATAVINNYSAVCVLTGSVDNPFSEPWEAGLRLTVISGQDAGQQATSVVPIPANGSGEITVSFEVRGPAIITCEEAVSRTGLFWPGASFSLMSVEKVT